MKYRLRIVGGILLLLTGLALISRFIWISQPHENCDSSIDSVEAIEPAISEAAISSEEDLPPPRIGLFITERRKEYQDSSLILRIPVLNLTTAICDGTDPDDLRRGVGLYDYAQLPGEGNRNVSIAGHRNNRVSGKVTDDAPFYYIDTLKDGDYLYVYDAENVYRYCYLDTCIIEQDDWSVIYTQGFSCLTITSCHPIGISDHRIVVRGKLDEILPYFEEFDFLASKPEFTGLPRNNPPFPNHKEEPLCKK